MLSLKAIIKFHIILLSVSLLLVSSAFSKSVITQKLWQGINSNDLEVVKKVFIDIENKNYNAALKKIDNLKKSEDDNKPDFSAALTDIVFWHKYRGEINPKNISFSDISRFVNDNGFFPDIENIKKNAEEVAIANDIPYQSSKMYFKANPALSKKSKLYLVESKIEDLERSRISDLEKDEGRKNIRNDIARIWIEDNFSIEEEERFLKTYQNQLTEIDHINRIERLLWDDRVNGAKRIMSLVNEDRQKLFNAVITLIRESPRYLDKVILSVPRRLRSNELLSYRKVLWYRARDKQDDLIDIILDLPRDSKYADRWWGLRRLYGRELLKTKEYKTSYKIISRNNLKPSDKKYWEAQWTSGWIALRFLDDPEDAYDHFENLYNNVVQPVTISRAAYWLGMSSEAMGNKSQAIKWYKVAAKYPIYFYGQLAIHKHRILDPIGSNDDIILPKDPDITGRDIIKISNSRATQVAYLLSLFGDKKSSKEIFKWVVWNAPTKGQIAVVMQVINELGDRELDSEISRVAARKNVFFIEDKFQIVKQVKQDEYSPLVHAIIKQESGFVPSAVSKVGAIGFMQIMPNTAKLITREMGIGYSKYKLARSISYNVKLGTHYIKKLIDRFDGSEMIAIAAYNAGPNNAQRWINEFYDPRETKDIDKVVDWIELITYSETRNYVQRIMENLIVYKYLMSRKNYDEIR